VSLGKAATLLLSSCRATGALVLLPLLPVELSLRCCRAATALLSLLPVIARLRGCSCCLLGRRRATATMLLLVVLPRRRRYLSCRHATAVCCAAMPPLPVVPVRHRCCRHVATGPGVTALSLLVLLSLSHCC